MPAYSVIPSSHSVLYCSDDRWGQIEARCKDKDSPAHKGITYNFSEFFWASSVSLRAADPLYLVMIDHVQEPIHRYTVGAVGLSALERFVGSDGRIMVKAVV